MKATDGRLLSIPVKINSMVRSILGKKAKSDRPKSSLMLGGYNESLYGLETSQLLVRHPLWMSERS